MTDIVNATRDPSAEHAMSATERKRSRSPGSRLVRSFTAARSLARVFSPRMSTVRSEWLHAKTEPVATHGMVTAEHPLAAEAGVEIMRDGGNAVDAAVAAALVMNVVEPFTSGIGGIAGLVIRTADGKVTSIQGGTAAPKAARPDMFELAGGDARAG